MRIDKWLWAARFYKTRQLAVKAIKTGKISLNHQTVSKPAALLKVQDQLTIKRGPYHYGIAVDALSEHRGSASVAQTLYHETEASISERARLKLQLAAQPKIQIDRHKPNKRGVREQRALKRGD